MVRLSLKGDPVTHITESPNAVSEGGAGRAPGNRRAGATAPHEFVLKDAVGLEGRYRALGWCCSRAPLTGHLRDSQHVHPAAHPGTPQRASPRTRICQIEADAVGPDPEGPSWPDARRPGARHSVAGARWSFSQAGKSFRLRSTTSAPAAVSSSADAGPVATVTDRAPAARAASTSAGWSPT